MSELTITARNAAGDALARVRVEIDDEYRPNPLDDWEHGVSVRPVALPAHTSSDYYTAEQSNDPLGDAWDRFAETFGAVSYYGNARQTAEVFTRWARIFHPAARIATASLRGYSQGDWADVIAWSVDPDSADPAGVLEELGNYARGDVYGLITEEPQGNPDDDEWEEVESVWGVTGTDYATTEAFAILAANYPATARWETEGYVFVPIPAAPAAITGEAN